MPLLYIKTVLLYWHQVLTGEDWDWGEHHGVRTHFRKLRRPLFLLRCLWRFPLFLLLLRENTAETHPVAQLKRNELKRPHLRT